MAATQRAIDLAKAVSAAAEDKLASKIVAIDVSEQLALTDIFVLASAPNDRQVSAIVDGVEDKLRALGVKPVRHSLFGMVADVSTDKRLAWLKEVEALGTAAM